MSSMCTMLLVGAAAVGASLPSPVGTEPVETRSFARSPLGHELYVAAPAAPRAPEPKEGNAPIDAVPGFAVPGSVIRDGDRLYVGNNDGEITNTISVVDISGPEAEAIVDTIVTPVNPVDIAIVDGVLYVIDQHRDALHYRTLASGDWDSIPIPNGTVTEWSYGSILYPKGNRIFITHFWENLISVVNLDTLTVETTITDLDHLPDRIEFTDTHFVVLAKGLDAPSCFATGPNFSLFRLDDLSKVYRRDISGRCALAMTLRGDDLYVVFNDDIDRHDLVTGDFVDSYGITFLDRHITHNGEVLLGTTEGYGFTLDFELNAVGGIFPLLETAQTWFPPLEETYAMPADDGRWFITNRNDDSVSVVRLGVDPKPDCPGDVDGDGDVDFVDLSAVLVAWGACDGCPEDIDGNGSVGFADLSTVLTGWGPC